MIPPRLEEEAEREMGEGEEISACTLHPASPTSYNNRRTVYTASFSKPAATASPSNANLQQQEAYILVIPHDSEGGARAVETEEEVETVTAPAAMTTATT